MEVGRWKHVRTNFFFVTAWNEWNEQAILEPDDVNGFGYFEALQSVRVLSIH
jgi:hypothetical protein